MMIIRKIAESKIYVNRKEGRKKWGRRRGDIECEACTVSYLNASRHFERGN